MEATYNVKLTFSGELTNKEKSDIAKNILNCLVHESNTVGIVPDNSDAFTKTITVYSECSGTLTSKVL